MSAAPADPPDPHDEMARRRLALPAAAVTAGFEAGAAGDVLPALLRHLASVH